MAQHPAEVLANHPSVQDLDVMCTGVNNAKVAHYTRRINAGPLVDPLAIPQGKPCALGQRVAAFRYEKNISRAKRGGGSDIARLPLKAKQVQQKTETPLPSDALLQKTAAPLPPHSAGRRSASTVFSFEGTDAQSFSVYSCSCCHVAPPSSTCTAARSSAVGSVADTEDNMTSISQRIAPSNVSCGTIATVKLRQLEKELSRERADRKRTQKELQSIKERQELLLSKLSERERAALNEFLVEKSPKV